MDASTMAIFMVNDADELQVAFQRWKSELVFKTVVVVVVRRLQLVTFTTLCSPDYSSNAQHCYHFLRTVA